MADTKTETSADELRRASARLRCDHVFPLGSFEGDWLAPCEHCGLRPGDCEVSDRLREPLASLLDTARRIARAHPQDPTYEGLPDTRYCLECLDEETDCVQVIAGALAVARALNGGAS